jgi:ferritin-like metal-binding protein YciE
MQQTEFQPQARKLFVAGLENIHAIQRDAKSMMLKLIDRLENYPEARERLRAHLGDKEREMDRAEKILADMGESASGAKDSMFSAMGGMTAALTGGRSDDVLQSSMLTFGLANYEIALYEALIALAEPAGQPEAQGLLRDSLSEERAMADWLHQNLKPTLDRYLELSEDGHKAAH